MEVYGSPLPNIRTYESSSSTTAIGAVKRQEHHAAGAD